MVMREMVCHHSSSGWRRKWKMRWIFAPGFVLFAMAGSAIAAPQIFPSQDGVISFSTPTGNIGCVYIPAGGTGAYFPKGGGPELQCDRTEPTYLRFFLYKSGKAERFTNVRDASCCAAQNVLVYGNSWSKGPFRCKSERKGLTCTRGGHGFVISRARTRVY
jgi:hypothetical protein